ESPSAARRRGFCHARKPERRQKVTVTQAGSIFWTQVYLESIFWREAPPATPAIPSLSPKIPPRGGGGLRLQRRADDTNNINSKGDIWSFRWHFSYAQSHKI